MKRIARELGCSHHTVKAYVAAGGMKPLKAPARTKLLDGHEDWLRERFIRHRGNADVVRQDLLTEKDLRQPTDAAGPKLTLTMHRSKHMRGGRVRGSAS